MPTDLEHPTPAVRSTPISSTQRYRGKRECNEDGEEKAEDESDASDAEDYSTLPPSTADFKSLKLEPMSIGGASRATAVSAVDGLWQILRGGSGRSIVKLSAAMLTVTLVVFGLARAFPAASASAPNELRQRVSAATAAALEAGSLAPISLHEVGALRDEALGVTFVVAYADPPAKPRSVTLGASSTVSDPLAVAAREPSLEVARGADILRGVGGGGVDWSAYLPSLGGFSLVLNKFPSLRDHCLLVGASWGSTLSTYPPPLFNHSAAAPAGYR